MSTPVVACRSTRTMEPVAATRGAPMVGTPPGSTVRRTRASACWIAIHASEPSGRQAMATGFVKKSRGASAVSRFTPWSRLRGAVRRTEGSVWAATTSNRLPMLNPETIPCAFELKRNGPFGDAPVLTTYARDRTGWMATAASWFGKQPVVVVKVWGLVEGTAGTWLRPGARRPLELNPVFV